MRNTYVAMLIGLTACGVRNGATEINAATCETEWRRHPPSPQQAYVPILSRTQVGVLSNGTKVVLVPRPNSPLVAIRILVAHDDISPQTSAASTVASHAAFWSPGFLKELDNVGGDVSFETGIKHSSFAVATVTEGAAKLASAMGKTLAEAAREEDLTNGKGRAKIRLASNRKSGYMRSLTLLEGLIFPTIGEDQVLAIERAIESTTCDQADDFFRSKADACHVTVIFAGGLSFGRAMELGEQLIASWPNVANCRVPDLSSLPRRATDQVMAVSKVGSGTVADIAVGCRGPARGAVAWFGFNVALRMLATRAYKVLREERGLLYGIDVDARDRGMGTWGFVSIGSTMKHADLVVDWIRRELEALARGDFSDGELARAKSVLRTGFLQGFGSIKELAMNAMWDVVAGVPVMQPRETLDRLARVTRADVREALEKCGMRDSRGTIVLSGEQ